MDVKRFTLAAPEMSEFVKSLANPLRLRILCALVAQESSVGALSAGLGVAMSSISQQLALLRQDRLVSSRRSKQTIFYALSDEKVVKIIGGLAEEFCRTELDKSSGGGSRR